MTNISHHIPESLLIAYASGQLSHAYSLVVAAHVSMCAQCRAALEAHSAVGGVLLEQEPEIAMSDASLASLMARLDDPAPEAVPQPKMPPYPAPVVTQLGGRAPKWSSLGFGVKQAILSRSAEGSVRLLSIEGGVAVPDHSHGGLELTLVLQGSFRDESGVFRRGDLEVADETDEHTPVAEPGEPCICLAATDAPLRFQGMIPRLLQPLFRI